MNIYIRTQDNDLCKYLSSTETEQLLGYGALRELKIGEYLLAATDVPDYLVTVVAGRLDQINPAGDIIGSIYTGEIDGEVFFLSPSVPPYALRAYAATQLMLIKFEDIKAFIGADYERASRIHAALNDCLCLKIIRLTHLEHKHD